jgi:ActR/RegA family two-component response regulator
VCPDGDGSRSYDGDMASPLSLVLVSDDLMFASQLNAAMTRVGGSCALVVSERIPPADAVFVDLNRDAENRLALIAELRGGQPGLTIVGFCHHGERVLRRRALDFGATRVINNGALQAAALRLAGINVHGRP